MWESTEAKEEGAQERALDCESPIQSLEIVGDGVAQQGLPGVGGPGYPLSTWVALPRDLITWLSVCSSGNWGHNKCYV